MGHAAARVVIPTHLRGILQHTAEQKLVAGLFDATHIVPLTDAVNAAAAVAPPPLLRSIDAVHLASAQAARGRDRRAETLGLRSGS